MLKGIFLLSSVATILGGAVLFFTWAANWATDPQHHVPVIVLAIGASMMIQGLYSAGYSLGWWTSWGDVASGALLAGQLISGCVALGMLVNGIIANSHAANGDIEMVPVLAGLMIGANALVALIYLFSSGKISITDITSRSGSAFL